MPTAKVQLNSTQIPNYLLDEVMPFLTDTELRVLMIICRQTYGWHKDSDRLSYSQLVLKTKSSRRSIAYALKSLKEKGLITVYQDGQDLSYSICTSAKIAPVTSAKNALATSAKIAPTKETNTKETLTKEEKEIDKEKENRSVTVVTSSLTKYSSLEDLTSSDFKDIAQKYQVPISFVLSKMDDMMLWAGSRPANSKLRGRNWRLTLMKFVKDDAVKIHERRKGDPTKRAVDARNL